MRLIRSELIRLNFLENSLFENHDFIQEFSNINLSMLIEKFSELTFNKLQLYFIKFCDALWLQCTLFLALLYSMKYSYYTFEIQQLEEKELKEKELFEDTPHNITYSLNSLKTDKQPNVLDESESSDFEKIEIDVSF